MSKQIERKARAATAVRERLLQIRSRRAETERRIATLRVEREQAEHDAAMKALLPGGAAVATAPAAISDLEEEIRRLESEEAEAVAALEAAERAYQESILQAVPGAAEGVANAREVLRAALAELGEVALERYREVLAAEAKHRERAAELEALANRIKGDPRLASRQRGELRRWLQGTAEDGTPEEVAGWLVARLMGWSRRPSSPVEGHWRRHGVPIRGESVLLPGGTRFLVDTDVMNLRARRLPL